MRTDRLLIAWAIVVALILGAAPAQAHLTDFARENRHSTVSLESAQKFARATHHEFRLPRNAHDAQHVGTCESGIRRLIRNGSYWYTFQMGTRERQTYGYGRTFREQAAGARRYFVASGYSWGPWADRCEP